MFAPILADAGYRVLIPYLRGYGETRFLAADTPRNAQPAAVATDAVGLFSMRCGSRRSCRRVRLGGRTAKT